MINHSNVLTLDSVESDPFYLQLVKNKFSVQKVNFTIETDRRYYPYVRGDHAPYGLIFIDGRMRNKCLEHAIEIGHKDVIVVLHDAQRESYRLGTSLYDYQYYTDGGHTVVLTNDRQKSTDIKRILSSHTI